MVEGPTSALLRWAHRRRLVVAVLLLGVLAGVVPLFASLRFDSDVLNLLPQRGPAVRHFRAFLETFGSLDRLYVAFTAPPGRFVSEYETDIEAYAAHVRALPGIRWVDTGPADAGEHWDYLLDNALIILNADGDLLGRFEADGIAREVAHARERLTLPSADVVALVREDPLGLTALLREHLGEDTFAFGATADGYVTADGGSRLLVVEPDRPPYDTAFSRGLLRALDEIETGLDGGSAAGLTIRRAGGYRVSTETEDLIRTEGIVNATVSLSLVLLLVFVVFRSVRVLLAAAIPLLLALALTIAVNGFWWPLSTAATGCAAMLFGLGVDGVLLLYVRYLEERRGGLDAESAVGGLSGSVGSMWLGFTTTAAIYFGLTLIDFPSLNEVGRLVGVAILLSGALVVLVVPALLPRTLSARQARTLPMGWLGRFVSRHRRAIVWSSAALTVVASVAALDLRVVPSLQRLQPQTAGTRVEREILATFAVPDDTLLMVAEGDALEPLLEAQWRLARDLAAGAPWVPTSSPAGLLPPRTRQEASRGALQDSGLTPAIVSARLRRAAAAVGFRPDAFEPFESRLPRLLDARGGPTLDGYLAAGLGDLIGRYVRRTSGGYMVVAYAYPRNADDYAALEAIVRAAGQPVTLTGTTFVNRELSSVFRPQLVRGAVIGVLASLLLAFVVFRRVWPTLLSVLPTAVGVLWSAGVLAAAGVELDLFSVFALLMCVGIGVDYSIHVLHRQSSSGIGVVAVLDRVSPAIVLAWITTCIGFGTLTMSAYGPLRSLGIVSVVTVTACLLSAIVLLPAVMLMADRRQAGLRA